MVGETLHARHEFRELFTAEAVSLVNPDICVCGILEIRAIAAMAATYKVTVSPHNYNSMAFGTAISANTAAGISNLGLCEYFPELGDAWDELWEGQPKPVDGALAIPTTPGFGITVDDGAIEKYRVKS